MSVVKRFRNDDSGQIGMLFGLSIFVLAGLAGAVVDYSRANAAKVRLSAAADAAALAGAIAGAEQARPAAQNFFAQNFPDPVDLQVEIQNDIVRVTASQSVPTSLLNVIGYSQLEVGTTSAAVIGGAARCILALDPDKIGISVNSASTIDANCGIHINSSDQEALFVNSGSRVTASEIRILGLARINSRSRVEPTPRTGTPPLRDPLAQLPAPDLSTRACNHTDFTVNNNEIRTLLPGVYCGKTLINSGARVTFASGIYVFRQGQLEVNSDAAASGRQVMMYFQGKDASLKVNSRSTFDLTAPQTGDYAGILLFQDRDPATLSAPPFIVNSSSFTRIEGTIYLPNGTLEINSESRINEAAEYTAIIARNIVVNSASTLVVRAFSGSGRTPMPLALGGFRNMARLVE